MMRTPVAIFLSLVLGGCVAQPETPETIAAAPFDGSVEPPQIVCKKEKPTGSNRPVTVCREVAGPLDREQTRHDMSVLQRQSEQVSTPPPL